jgi:hypothetical protein
MAKYPTPILHHPTSDFRPPTSDLSLPYIAFIISETRFSVPFEISVMLASSI